MSSLLECNVLGLLASAPAMTHCTPPAAEDSYPSALDIHDPR
jgi:hypothetical protein